MKFNKKNVNSHLSQFLICVSVIFLFLIVSKIFYGFFRLGDDTYIYLQYARNFIEHRELAFNSGELTYGFTSPLWLFFIIIIVKISGSYLQAPHLLTLFFSIATIIVWFFILKKSSLNPLIKYFLLIVIALDPNLIKHSYLGMEASASFFLSSIVILILVIDNARKFKVLIPIIFGLFFLLRPESFIIYLIVIISFLITKKIIMTDVIIMLILTLIVIMPWTIFTYFYFNSVIPTTFGAKGAVYGFGMKFFNQIFDSIKIFFGNYFFLIASIFTINYKVKLKRKFDTHKSLFYISIVSIIVLITFYSLTLNKEFVYARYYCMVFPFLYLLLMISLKASEMKPKRGIYFLTIVFLYSIGITVIFSNLTRSYFQDEQLEDKIAIWIIENTKTSDLIVRGRIGKIGFLSERKVIDPIGIINPAIIYYIKGNRTSEYYAIVRPKYFIGSFDIQSLRKYGDVKLVKKFDHNKSSLPRLLNFQGSELMTTPVYKVEWY